MRGNQLLAVGLGATLMYVLDPVQGRRRRAMLRDAGVHRWRMQRRLFSKAGRDLSHRAHGAVERIAHPTAAEAPDPVIAERIRARLGRLVSHPSSIEVRVESGRAMLSGPVLAAEARGLRDGVARVPGVVEVADDLEVHEAAAGVPGLQGAGQVPTRWPGREQWPPAARLSAGVIGGALAAWGLAHRGLVGAAAALVGGGLVTRAALDRPLERLVRAGPERIEVQKTLTVHAPIDLVYGLWSRLENFPRFMEHVREVRIDETDPRRSHWTVDGPAGTSIGFTAETTRLDPEHTVSWRTLPHQSIEHAGTVHFEEAGDATRLHLVMHYAPPAGMIGHAVARLLGCDPRSRIDEDLVRMKGLLEDGRTRVHGRRVTTSEADLAW